MAEIKVSAGKIAANVAPINDITIAVNKLGKAVSDAGKMQFKPVDITTAARDVALLNKQFELAIKNSKALRDSLKNSGQSGMPIQDVDFSKLSVDPLAAQRMRDKAFGFSARGTAWDMANFAPAPGAQPAPPPGQKPSSLRSGSSFFSQVGRNFSSGFGGGFGQIANRAIGGAEAGAAGEGGIGGGVMGLLKGTGIGTAIYGVYKAGQAVSEGMDMAKERGATLDTLKRQMGDLGVGFENLKEMTDKASAELGVNSKEFADLSKLYNSASHNSDKTPEALGNSVRDATGFARAYGIDPSQSASFFGGMKNLDQKSNNRDLALQIAEAIGKSGGRAMAGDVMQFMQTMAASTARMSLSAPNTDAYAAAYGSMMSKGGMISDMVGSMIGQTNSAISNMGMAGEAGKNFQLGAINQYGYLNPIAARALSADGMFGTRNSVFGNKDSQLSKYLASNGIDSKSMVGANGGVTTWEAMKRSFNNIQDPWLRLSAVQRDLGLNSPQQAAAMMNLDSKQIGTLGGRLEKAGVNLQDFNSQGITTLADINGAGSKSELDKIYGGIINRTGAGSLSEDEKKSLNKLQGGDTEKFRDALFNTMAGKDQEDSISNDTRRGTKALESLETSVGDKLIPATNAIRDGVLALAGVKTGKTSPLSFMNPALDGGRIGEDAQDTGSNSQKSTILKNFGDWYSENLEKLKKWDKENNPNSQQFKAPALPPGAAPAKGFNLGLPLPIPIGMGNGMPIPLPMPDDHASKIKNPHGGATTGTDSQLHINLNIKQIANDGKGGTVQHNMNANVSVPKATASQQTMTVGQ